MSKSCWKRTGSLFLNLRIGKWDSTQGALGWHVAGMLGVYQQAGSPVMKLEVEPLDVPKSNFQIKYFKYFVSHLSHSGGEGKDTI